MQDLRLAVRALRATPIVTTVAILSLALGVGANTAIFSLVNSLLLRSLPVHDPSRLVLVTSGPAAALGSTQAWSHPLWSEIRQRPNLFDRACAWSLNRFNLSSVGQTEFVDGAWVSGGYFDTLGVPALVGRTLTDDDDRRGGGSAPVAVVSYQLWQRRFGGAADVIGRTLPLGDVPFTIVGVTPPEFFGADVGQAVDVFVPIGDEPLLRGRETWLDRRTWPWLTIMARLKPRQDEKTATAELRTLQPQIAEAILPTFSRRTLETSSKEIFTLIPAATGNSTLRRRYERPLLIVMVVVALVLVIACANVAHMLLARATARRHELSVHVALGASRWRLARRLLIESVLIAGVGAACGTAAAALGSRVLVQQLSTPTARVFLDLSIDWHLLAFTIGVTTATVLLFGTAPAFRAACIPPIEALRHHHQTSVGEARMRLTSALVIAQVALSVVLLVAAGLFVRTFASLATRQLGFERERVLVVEINAQRTALTPAQRIALFERMRDAVRPLPGVDEAALSLVTPVSGIAIGGPIEVSGGVRLPPGQPNGSDLNYISPGWFSTFGTPLIGGRDITAADRQGSPMVAVVNQAFARKFLNGANPIGHTITVQAPGLPVMEIVGLAGDAVYRFLRDPVPPTIYVPLAQNHEPAFPWAAINLSVRASRGAPASLTRSISRAIAAVNPQVAVTFIPLADRVNAALTQERLLATLSGFFGALAVILAGVGLYGVMAYAVTRRRVELGIRIALGAGPNRLMRLVLSRVLVLVGVGVLVGAGASLWASKFVATLLYGLEPRDPATLVGAAATLAFVGAVAGWVPAYRASRVEPAHVLQKLS